MSSLPSDILFRNTKVPYHVMIIKFSVEYSDIMITSISLIHIVLMMRLLDDYWDLVKCLGNNDKNNIKKTLGEHEEVFWRYSADYK